MKEIQKSSMVALLLFLLALAVVPAASAQSRSSKSPPASSDAEAVLVGRISFVEGQLLRYVPEKKDWVATVKDAPFGMDDALYSDVEAKAEFVMPNGTTIRIGESTQIQVIALKGDVTEVDVALGTARFYGKNQRTLIKVSSPFGYVIGQPGACFDIVVGGESQEVIAVNGDVSFVHEGDNQKYPVTAGSSSVIADNRNVSFGSAEPIPDWNNWNVQRDSLWAKRLQVRGDSTRYLPEDIQDQAPDLDENGRWERVYNEGEYHEYWRPTTVDEDWAPYTDGRWTDYYGDNCWVPDEPFGYVTHHYGDWVYVGNYWYWAPPVVTVGVGVPYWGIGFGWYPGRVGWVYSGVQIGWFPLAPFEPFYCVHPWGPGALVVGGFGGININININNYRYCNRAVIVNQNHFYNVRNYNTVRVTNVNRTAMASNFRGAPVVSNNVIRNSSNMQGRYNFTNAAVQNKPSVSAVGRIQQNQVTAANSRAVSAGAIQKDVARTSLGSAQTSGQITSPRVSGRAGTTTGTQPGSVNRGASAGRGSSQNTMGRASTGTGSSVGSAAGRGSSQNTMGRASTGTGSSVGSAAGSTRGGVFRPERPSAASLQREAGRSGASSGQRSLSGATAQGGAGVQTSGRSSGQVQSRSSGRSYGDSRQTGTRGGNYQSGSGYGRQAGFQGQGRSTGQRQQSLSNGYSPSSRQYQRSGNTAGEYRGQGQAGSGSRGSYQGQTRNANPSQGSVPGGGGGGRGMSESRGFH